MTRLACTFVVALVALVAPAFASAATPTFEARTFETAAGAPSDVALDLTIPADNAAPAKIVIYVPQGYGVNTGAAPGTTVGTIDAVAHVGGSDLTIPTGSIVADTPGNYTSNPQAQACAPGSHAAVWVAKAGSFSIPIYVDPTSGAEAALGGYKLQTCLLSPDVPESAGGAPLGARLIEAQLGFTNTVLTNPSTKGSYLWRVAVTPFTAGSSTVNAAGTYELRSVVYIPATLTIKKKSYSTKTKVLVLTGVFKVLGSPVKNFPVFIYTVNAAGNVKLIGHPKTNKKGVYVFKLKLKATTRFAALALGFDGACEATPPAVTPAGCLHETETSVFSDFVRVVKR